MSRHSTDHTLQPPRAILKQGELSGPVTSAPMPAVT